MDDKSNELDEFIKSQLDQDVPKDEIRATLQNQGGWTEEDLDRAFTSFSETPRIPQKNDTPQSLQEGPKALAGIPFWSLLVITIVFIGASLHGTYLYDTVQYFFHLRFIALITVVFSLFLVIYAIVTYRKLKNGSAYLQADTQIKVGGLLLFWYLAFIFVVLDFLSLLFLNALGGVLAASGNVPTYIIYLIIQLVIITLYILLLQGLHKKDFSTLKKKFIMISLPVIILVIMGGVAPIFDTVEYEEEKEAFQESLIENPNNIAMYLYECPDCKRSWRENIETVDECKAMVYSNASEDGRYTEDEKGVCGFGCKSLVDFRNPKKKGEDLCEEYIEIEFPTENYYVASGSPRVEGNIHIADWKADHLNIQGSDISIYSPEKYYDLVSNPLLPTWSPLFEGDPQYNIGILLDRSICNVSETNFGDIWDYQDKPNEVIPNCIVMYTGALVKSFEQISSILDPKTVLQEDRVTLGGKEFLKITSTFDGAGNKPPEGMDFYTYVRKVPAEEYGGFSNYFIYFDFAIEEQYLELYELIIGTAAVLPWQPE